MKWYNDGDVVTLKAAYYFILPYDEQHPNETLFASRKGCPNCGGQHSQSRGVIRLIKGNYQRLQCQDCGRWYKGELLTNK